MASLWTHHQELTDGEGKCSVPMWAGGCPAGFCDASAYGNQTADGKQRYDGYVMALACYRHGGPKKEALAADLCEHGKGRTDYCQSCGRIEGTAP